MLSEPTPVVSSGDRPLVLIVDDEVLVRRLIADILQDEGFVEAKDATKALRVLEARADVDLHLPDAEMPPGPKMGSSWPAR